MDKNDVVSEGVVKHDVGEKPFEHWDIAIDDTLNDALMELDSVQQLHMDMAEDLGFNDMSLDNDTILRFRIEHDRLSSFDRTAYFCLDRAIEKIERAKKMISQCKPKVAQHDDK